MQLLGWSGCRPAALHKRASSWSVRPTLGTIEARARLVGGGTALIHLRVGGPALGAQILGALLGRARLRQHAGGGTEFGFRLLGLQLQIDLVESGERLTDIDGLANFNQALGDLAGNPEAHVRLDPGPDGADKAALGGFGRVMDGSDQHRTARAAVSAAFSLQPANANTAKANDAPVKSL